MKKINNKGLSVVELIVSFVLCLLVFIFIIQVVSSVEELYINLGIKTELLNRQALISEKINNKFLDNKTILIKSCGDDCLTFFYKNQTSEKLQIDKNNNNFIIGNDVFNFSGLGFVDSLSANITSDYAYSHSILTISLNIKNSVFDDGKYIIKAYLQFNNDEVVYSPSTSNKAEIFLLGPAVSYKFSEDLFVEPGWIVYYPSGKITINAADVKSSGLNYDSDNNAFIKYTGTGEAAGSEKTRTIKNYKLAKDYIIDSYEKSANSGIYLYSELGRYVYKGENPNNYIALGNKLFRIISLDIQSQYVIGEDGKVLTIDGIKQKENKYLLKVVSDNYLEDEEGEQLIPFGASDSSSPIYYVSPWSREICATESCYTESQYINTLVNNVYLKSLLNTGTGKQQIKNGTFNVGNVDRKTYRFSAYGIYSGDQTRYSYSAKEIYEVEGADFTYAGTTDPGKWNGECVDDVCEPNAAILSLTDILFSSSNAECLDTIVIQNGVKCVHDNWLWSQKSDTEDRQVYRLMTRASHNLTWLLTELNYLSQQTVTEKYRTKPTLYLDADLYIMGSGTKESPYVLYTMKKGNN